MKKIIQNIPRKIRIFGLFSLVCLLLTGGILICEQQIQKDLYDQQMAKRWSQEGNAAQVSAFYAEGAVEDAAYFKGIAQSIDKALQAASIVNEKENARLWIDSVSKSGKVVLSSERAYIELSALGVSGEFFQFHPQKIVSGALFSEESMMQDGVVIDEETAWQLFGSSDVAGMQIMIGQVPHFITGVIERPKGRLESAAGLEKSVCYLSLDSLQKLGTTTGGFTYEVVMPNPIKGFALSTMQNAVGAEKENIILVENSTRYDFLSLIRVIRDFGIRSMSFKGIVYPYWENIARGQEDILALFFIIKCLLMAVPGIFILIVIIYFWKRRTWHIKDLILWIQDKIYEAGAKRNQRKKEGTETEKNKEEEK